MHTSYQNIALSLLAVTKNLRQTTQNNFTNNLIILKVT